MKAQVKFLCFFFVFEERNIASHHVTSLPQSRLLVEVSTFNFVSRVAC